jgi:hypothetical protein
VQRRSSRIRSDQTLLTAQDVAVPNVQTPDVEFGSDARYLGRVGDDSVLPAHLRRQGIRQGIQNAICDDVLTINLEEERQC